MPIWKPPGTVTESHAKWESNPDRSKFFLQNLVDANIAGTFKGTPNVATYNKISKMLWARYDVYHTPKQLKNYYGNRKAFWANVCWARERTGVGWDDTQKMLLASDEWWRGNEGRKGLLALRGKPIQDYDLLHTLFHGQRAVVDHCYSPFDPIPLTSDEGSGDSESPEDNQFFEPQTQASQGAVSMNTSSGSKRQRKQDADITAKKQKNTKKNEERLSPYSAQIDRKFNSLCDAKARRRMRLEIGSDAPGSTSAYGTQIASKTPSGTINSLSNMDKCMKIITDVLRLDDQSDFYFGVLDLLHGNPDGQSIFLGNENPTAQLAWLKRKVGSLDQGSGSGTNARSGYDLNEPPI